MSRDAAEPSSRPAVPGKLAVGCAGVLVPMVVGMLWMRIDDSAGPWLPLFALGVHLLLSLAARGRSWRLLAPLCALAVAPLFYLRAAAALGVSDQFHPFVDDGCEPSFFFGPTRFTEGISEVLLLVPATVAGFLVARWLVRAERRGFPPLLHAASLGALAASAIALGILLARAVTAPDAGHYIETLPVLGVVPPVSGEPAQTEERGGFIALTYDTPIADLVVSRICPSNRSTCWIVVRPAGTPPLQGKALVDIYPPMNHDVFFGEDCSPPNRFQVQNEPIVVHEDRAHGLLFFEGELRRAVKRSTFSLVDVQMHEIADVTSAPRGWMATAAAGVALASLLKLLRRRAARRLDRIAAAQAGALGEDGWIEFEDGSAPLRVGQEARVSPGPVVVLQGASPPAAGGPYRGEERRAEVEILAGDKAEILTREMRALAPLDAQALAIVVLTAAPLFAFVQVWLMR